MHKEAVIIIGGGASGLMAAKMLARQYDVTILEAASRLGGRILSKPSRYPLQPIEGGAEFIHGHQKQTIRLLKKAGIEYVPVAGNMYRKENGAWIEQTEMIDGWDELLKKMKKVKTDITMYEFLQEYFANDQYSNIRRHATNYAEGFDLADIKNASVQSLYNEWSNEEEENFRIPSGYGALITYLNETCEKKGCHILTNHLVSQVDWEKNDVTVYTGNNNKFSCKKLIVTLPVHILGKAANKASINFTPPLDEYINASNEIGVGAVIKVVARFRTAFWKPDMGFVFSDEIFPTWWTQLPDKRPVLSGWAGGPKAEQLSHLTDEQVVEKAMLSLSSIFDRPLEELKKDLEEVNVFNWQSEELNARGYSYSTLQTNAARRLLNTPIENTIFFAGEALYDGKSPGTVEAALVSGKKVASKILI